MMGAAGMVRVWVENVSVNGAVTLNNSVLYIARV
jgi:hypothetical protein